ncbi:MAG TPA: hypothetical protein VGB85_00480, partial [Nannocystis sp.]
PRPVRDFLPDFDYHDLEATLRAALRYRPEDRTPTMSELRDGLDLARECLLAQREEIGAMTSGPKVSAPAEREQVAVDTAAKTPPHAEGGQAEASYEPTREPAPREQVKAVQTPLVPSRPRGRLAGVALAAGLGLAAGIGGTLAMRPGEPVQFAVHQEPVAARMELERARAEARADRCEAEAARQTPRVELAPPSPSSAPSQPPSPSPDRPAARVLAASRAVSADRPASTKSPNAMARLAPEIRACARKGGIPEGPITVQVRRQGGVIDSVKLLKFSKDHPSVPCIDKAIRKADPPGNRPLEDFTFSK